MADIFGSSSATSTPAATQPATGGGLADIFGGGAPSMMQQPAPQTASMTNIFTDAYMAIDCAVSRGASPGEYNIKAFFSNQQMSPLSAVTLQVAVQKYMRMTLQGITSSEIGPGSRQQVT